MRCDISLFFKREKEGGDISIYSFRAGIVDMVPFLWDEFVRESRLVV